MPPDFLKSRKYCRSTPGVLVRRREIDLDLTKGSNFFNEPRLRKVATGNIAIFYKHSPPFTEQEPQGEQLHM